MGPRSNQIGWLSDPEAVKAILRLTSVIGKRLGR
jgi:hypothetical protein